VKLRWDLTERRKTHDSAVLDLISSGLAILLNHTSPASIETVKAFWTDVAFEHAERGLIATTSAVSCDSKKKVITFPCYADAETGTRHPMNILLWVLQALAALLYGASGTVKVFMFDKISADVVSFGALPRKAWMVLGILELVCTVGLIVPAAFHWQPALTVVAATVLAIESIVFVWVHAKYGEIASIIVSSVLGLFMAFIAYGRMVLKLIS